MKQLILTALFAIITISNASAADSRTLSNDAEIFILTCGSGDEIYTMFGHTGIYIKDKNSDIDVVFNFGTFNFDTPFFYAKFARGTLMYQISYSLYSSFITRYIQMGINVRSQKLEFDSIEKQRLYDLLFENYKPENREYWYNFLYDNCATRVRDIIDKSTNTAIEWNYPDKKLSFWNLLDTHLNNYPWSQWGIHTILGQGGNKIATPQQYMFLPQYLEDQLNYATRDGKRLVNESKEILTFPPAAKSAFYKLPMTIFIIFTIVWIGMIISIKNRVTNNILVAIPFMITGILGLVLIFLGLFTRHPITGYNANLLWANPINIIVAITTFKSKKSYFYLYYLHIYLIILLGALISWFFLAPATNFATYSIIILMILLTNNQIFRNIDYKKNVLKFNYIQKNKI